MPKGVKYVKQGVYNRTSKCLICDKKFRGSIKMVNKIKYLHFKANHPEYDAHDITTRTDLQNVNVNDHSNSNNPTILNSHDNAWDWIKKLNSY